MGFSFKQIRKRLRDWGDPFSYAYHVLDTGGPYIYLHVCQRVS